MASDRQIKAVRMAVTHKRRELAILTAVAGLSTAGVVYTVKQRNKQQKQVMGQIDGVMDGLNTEIKDPPTIQKAAE